MSSDPICKDSKIVTETVSHHVEMASSFCEVPPGFFCLPGDVPADQLELSVNLDKAAIDGLKLPVDGPKPPVDGSEPVIDRTEARVHRSFEVGDGHGLSRAAHIASSSLR